MRRARFSGRHVAIAFALGLAGAIAACGGDDSVTPGETGGSGGTAQEGGKGGTPTTDASPDRTDAKVDSTPGTGGAAGADASPDRGGGGTGGTDASADGSGGGGGVDASPDVVAQPDAPRETTVDSTPPADQAVEARGPDATPDANDGGVTPTPDASPDVVADVTPDRAPDVVTPPVDANDGSVVTSDGNDAGTLTLAASTFSWDPGAGTLTGNDAGQLTWVATYDPGGGSTTLNATLDPTVDWSIYQNLQVHVNVTSGFVAGTQYHLALQGSGDAVALNITGDDDNLQDGDQVLFLGLDNNLDVLRAVGNLYIVVTSPTTNDAGITPPPVTIQVISVTLLQQ